MYCSNCGSKLPDNAKFCSNCGAPRPGSSAVTAGISSPAPTPVKRTNGFGRWFLKLLIVSVVVAGVNILLSNEDSGSKSSPTPSVSVSSPKSTTAKRPENGWHTEDGKQYYFKDSKICVGIHEIDGTLYYFHEDGALALNTTAEVDGDRLETDYSGRITAATVSRIGGNWSADKYHFGNNGTSSIMELSMDVEDCDRASIYIEASGMYGASVSCNWKVYVRSHGTWVFATELYFTEPSGTYPIRFDTPLDFDAITAYPTVQGNASYSAYYELVDVHMGF